MRDLSSRPNARVLELKAVVRDEVLRLLKRKDKTSKGAGPSVRQQLEVALGKLGGAHMLTVDNGTEFFTHRELSKNAGVRVFFCHPHCSTERGAIGNLNGLVCYFLPKRSCFKKLTRERMAQIRHSLNQRPRRCLDYLTPDEADFKEGRKSARTARCT